MTMAETAQIGNGSHNKQNSQEPEYFEWWYFNFLSQDGQKINVVFHETDIFGLKRKSFYSMTVKNKWGTQYFKKVELGSAFSDGKFLELGKTVVEDEIGVKLSLAFEGAILEGEIKKLAPPVAINDAILYQNEAKKSFWLVQIPRGSFSLVLETGAGAEEIKGFAYQDHQWGNIRIQDFVTDWVWGNFSNNNTSLIFFKIDTQGESDINRFIIVKDGQVEFSQASFQVPYFEVLKKQELQKLVNPSGLIHLPADKDFEFILSSDKIMRSRLNEEIGSQNASYIRWASGGKFRGQAEMKGISEYLRIRNK